MDKKIKITQIFKRRYPHTHISPLNLPKHCNLNSNLHLKFILHVKATLIQKGNSDKIIILVEQNVLHLLAAIWQ